MTNKIANFHLLGLWAFFATTVLAVSLDRRLVARGAPTLSRPAMAPPAVL